MRERTEHVAPGPWLVIDSNEGTWPPRPGWEVVNNEYLNPPADDDAPWLAVELHTGLEADAHHIASWHPAVALAVAGWLDDQARYWDAVDAAPAYMEGDPASAVARAYLGES